MPLFVHGRTSAEGLRVLVQQPALPHYRVPVFKELNAHEDVTLRVTYGAVPGLPNACPDGFYAWPTKERRATVFGRTFLWDSAQWNEASLKRTDVAVYSWNLNYVSLLPALLRARISGVGTVLWGHGRSIGQTRLRSRIRACAARLADAVVCYGCEGAKENVALGVRPSRIFVAPNSLDERPMQERAAELRKHPEDLRTFQRREGLSGTSLILFVSRLQAGNRLDLLCSALPRIIGQVPSARVGIIGSGDGERRRLQEMCDRLGVSPYVRFLGPIYAESALAPWFMTARVLCYPENLGLTALHSLAYGLPVVCGDDLRWHNPEAEAVIDGESGRLFRRGDAEDLARILVEVLTNEDQRCRLSVGALKMIAERYNLANMTVNMMAAMRAAAKRKGRN